MHFIILGNQYSDPAAPVQECIAQLILKHSEDKLKHILSKEERETSNWLQLLHSSVSSTILTKCFKESMIHIVIETSL